MSEEKTPYEPSELVAAAEEKFKKDLREWKETKIAMCMNRLKKNERLFKASEKELLDEIEEIKKQECIYDQGELRY